MIMLFKKIFNKKGYTIPFALGLLLFLFALGASMLVASFVNVKNSSIDFKQNQAYLYTRSFINIMEDEIEANTLGEIIPDVVKSMNKDNTKYQNEYKFVINSENIDSSDITNKEIINNPFNQDKIDVEMEVNYVTKLKGKPIATLFNLNVADTIDVVYKIKTYSGQSDSYVYEYEITGKYYCSSITKDKDTGKTVIKWKLDKYLGEIYTTQIKNSTSSN